MADYTYRDKNHLKFIDGISSKTDRSPDTAAATSATNAATSATNAATSATDAASSATTATTQASNASTSATSASSSATTATDAVGAVAWKYIFDASTTMGDPTTGAIRFNHATLASVTNLAFDSVTSDSGNPDISDYIASIDDGTNTSHEGFITIKKGGTPATFAVFAVTGAVTDNTTWLQVPVTHVSSNGSFSSSDAMYVSMTRSGNIGATGATGPQGPAGDVDDVLTTQGDVIYRGATTSARLGAGTSGYFLKTQGSGANPVWASAGTPDDDSVTSAKIVDGAINGAKIAMGSDAQGDVLYYNGIDYTRLGAGTSGDFLKTQGAGANPVWANVDTDLVNDTTPQLGGNLDMNGNNVGGVTPTEMGYVSGVTSSIQTQLNAKQATITGSATTIDTESLTANRAVISNGLQKIAVSAVTDTELGYVSGVTSAIQTQLGNKVARTSSTGSAILPSGTTAQRDGTPSAGYLRWNSTDTTTEVYDGSTWSGVGGGGPSLGTDSVIRTNAKTISENITFAGTENGSSVGPISVASGYTVTVTSGSTWTII